MSDQTRLPFFQRHSETSRQAALEAYETAPSLRAKVYRYIRRQHRRGATTEDVCVALELGGSTVRPRIVELREQGVIVTTDRTRKTRTGRRASIHMAAIYEP